MLRVFNNISVEGMASDVPSAVEKNDEVSVILDEHIYIDTDYVHEEIRNW